MTARVDAASIVRDRLSMAEAIRRYTGHRIVKDRVPCPLHNGVGRNMRVYEKTAHCFVCGETVNVIDLVIKLFDLSFKDALRKLDSDFGLGADTRAMTADEMREHQKKADERRREAERRAAEREEFDRTHRMYTDFLQILRDLEHKLKPWSDDWCEVILLKADTEHALDMMDGR